MTSLTVATVRSSPVAVADAAVVVVAVVDARSAVQARVVVTRATAGASDQVRHLPYEHQRKQCVRFMPYVSAVHVHVHAA